MVCVEEVLIWFKHLNQSLRIEVVCGLFEMCTPFELRFFSTLLENYGKRDFFHCLKEAEQKLNTETEILKLTNLTDPVVRSHLLMSLILIESSNRLCATRIFNLLIDELQSEKLTLLFPSDEKCLNDVILMLTLATHHPAFSFQQQSILSEKLVKLKEILGSLLPSRVQDYDLYNNPLWFSTLTPPPSTELDIIPTAVLSINPTLAAYVTDWPQDISSNQSPSSVNHVRVQLSNLELTGLEKNKNCRIKTTWTNGKNYDVVKSYPEVLSLHQKLLSVSQNTPVSGSDCIIPPISSAINSPNGDDECYDGGVTQLTDFFRQLSTNVSLLNHDVILAFLNSKTVSTPTGINPIPTYTEDLQMQRLRSPGGHNTNNYGQPTPFQPVSPPLTEVLSAEAIPQTNPSMGESRPSSRPTVLPSSPAASPLSSPVSSPYVSPPASGTSSRSASPWQQQQQTYNASGSYQQASYHRTNPSIPRALRSKSGNPNNCGSSSSSSSSGYGNNGQTSRTNNSKLQGMSTEELENVGLMKGAAGKLKKVLDSFRNTPPNGANLYHNNHHHNHHHHHHNNNNQCALNSKPPVTSSHSNPGAVLPATQLPSTYNFSPSSRQRSESSPSCSEYSSPPPSPPLLEGIQGQNMHLNSQTSSSSEENLMSDQSSTLKTELAKTPVSFVNSATYCGATTTTVTTTISYGSSAVNNYTNVVSTQTPSRQTNGLAESQSSIVTTAPMMLHPFKPNSLPVHQYRPSVGNHFAGLTPIIFDNRIHQINPALQVMGGTCNTSVPPPGIPRPAHLSLGVPLPQSPQDRSNLMMPFAPVMSTGPCTSIPPPSRNLTSTRNNNGANSVTTVSSMHGHSHNNSHRYTPPKGHAMDKNSVILPPQSQQSTHPSIHEVPCMIFSQPPPPVPSSAGGNIMTLPITNSLSNCNSTTSVSSAMGPMMSPSQIHNHQGSVVGTLSNGVAPIAVTVPYHSYMQLFPAHALQFMTTHSGATGVNNFISATLPHFSYPIPNGMNVSNGCSHNSSHDLIYNNHGFQLIAPPGTPNGGSNTLNSSSNVQQGALPPNATIVPPFPGICPFPQTMKMATCYNCGMPGHRGPDCKENTADDIAKNS